ncbi:unnamed protein product, partial [Ectocarpus sp. 12 AP-2014]
STSTATTKSTESHSCPWWCHCCIYRRRDGLKPVGTQSKSHPIGVALSIPHIVCRARSSSAKAGDGGYRETAALLWQARFFARIRGSVNKINDVDANWACTQLRSVSE